MQGNFEYFYTTIINAELQIEDIGNCTIEASNDLGSFYYLNIKTQLGITTILEAGPIIPDLGILPKSSNISYKRISFNENNIKKIIKSFLNNPYRNITQSREIEEETMYNNLVNILEYVKSNKDFT